MTGLHRSLPKRAWAHVYRVTGGIVAVSIVISIILTNLFMEVLSNGVNVQGLAVSVIMPIVLGGVPALIGFGLFAAGRAMRRPPSPSRPPPSAPPPG
jgi:hypothetical protein